MTLVITNADFLNGDILTGQTVDNPIIFYQSFYDISNISSANSLGGGSSPTNPPLNLWNPDTSSLWFGSGLSPGPEGLYEEYVIIENPNGETFNHVSIAGHNLSGLTIPSDTNATTIISPEVSNDGVVWNSINVGLFVQDPENNEPIVFYFDDNSSEYLRINMSFNNVTAVSAPKIAHVKAGQATVLQRREFSGVGSGSLSKHLRRTQNMSDSGQYLGQVVLSTKRMMSISQQNNTPTFVRDEIAPFIQHTQGTAQIAGGSSTSFFYAWRPATYPDDVLYGWTMDNITPTHQSGDSFGGRMEWSVSMECLS